MVFLDGTVISSIFGSTGDAPKEMFNNHTLLQGEVIGVVYPNEKFKSKTKQVIEYKVLVQQQKNGNGTHVEYPNCIPINAFGGGADRGRHTYRVRSTKPARGKTSGDGSKVLVLCLNGDMRNAYIIGGVNDTPVKDQAVESKESGHNLFFEFNGMQFTVDKEGQGKVMFRGATKVDGTLSDDANVDAEGTNVLFDKDGGVKIATPDDAQYVFVDHANKTVEILADENWKVTVNGKTAIEVQNDISINSSAGEIDVGAANNVKIQSAGVLVGDATDAWIKGTTYRAAESAMLGQLAAGISALTQAITQMGISMAAAAPIAPSFANPGLVSALAVAVPTLNACASAIQQFEGQASQYLSTKNKTD